MIGKKFSRRCGVDIGTHYTKVCIVESGKVIGSSRVKNNPDLKKVVKKATQNALKNAGLSPISLLGKGVTGYGAKYIASKQKTQSECIKKAMLSLKAGPVTVIDAGAIFLNIYTIDENGKTLDSSENDRCAAGNGSYIEMLASSFGVEIDEISALANSTDNPYELLSNCSVFAESEIVSQMNSGRDISDVAAGIFYLVAHKVSALMERIETVDDVIIVGGLARFQVFVSILEKVLARNIVVLDQLDPDFVQAYGAALNT
jgi:predicted CoA-substrate-specific enzyme activase